MKIEILLGEVLKRLPFQVVETLHGGLDVLLGLDNGLAQLDLLKREANVGSHSFTFVTMSKDLDQVLSQHSEVFSVENWAAVSQLEPVKILLKPGANP